MSSKALRKVIILATFSLLAVLGFQAFWLSRANALQSSRFTDMAFIALNNVAESLYSLSPQSGKILNPVKQVDRERFIVQVNDTLHPYLLENLLTQEFRKVDLTQEFEYAIYDCFTDSTVFGRSVNMNDQAGPESGYLENIAWNTDGHYFGVYFPKDKSEGLLPPQIISLLLVPLAAILLFFSYTLWVLFRERRFAEMRLDYAHHLAHELKTPITTIRMISKSLLQNPGSTQYTRILDAESHRLKRLAERTLGNEALLHGQAALNVEPIALHDFVTHAADDFSRGQAVRFSIDIPSDMVINADPMQLETVLWHLWENSVKYGGGKNLLITTSAQSGDNAIRLYVGDNGPGIPRRFRKKIFKRFFRIHHARELQHPTGYGLGLYYVHRLMKKFGGRIRMLDQQPGAHFELQFPRPAS